MNDNLINNLEYTVSELSNSIKRIIEDNFDYIRIKAEIGRVSKPNSGHIYLDLKDDASVISGIVWKGNFSGLRTSRQSLWRFVPRQAINGLWQRYISSRCVVFLLAFCSAEPSNAESLLYRAYILAPAASASP